MSNDKTIKFNRLIPELLVSSIEASKVFYVEQLGFTIEYERREDDFALISYEGSQFMLEQDRTTAWITGELGSIRGRGINFQIEVDCPILLLLKLKPMIFLISGNQKNNGIE